MEADAARQLRSMQKAMDAEIAQLDRLGTYELKELPADRKAISCTWVYHLKRTLKGK